MPPYEDYDEETAKLKQDILDFYDEVMEARKAKL